MKHHCQRIQMTENEKSLTKKSGFRNLGGGKRDRTADLLHAMHLWCKPTEFH